MAGRRVATWWLNAPTRFAGLAFGPARLAAAAAIVLILASWLALEPSGQATQGDGPGDVVLYGSIVEAVRHGASYYDAAAEAMRAGSYPLRPFVTMRLPTLAVVQAMLPAWLVPGLLGMLATAVLIVWTGRLWQATPRLAPRVASPILLAGGLLVFVQPGLVAFHEIWAGLLIALSLGLRTPDRWIESAALGLSAALVRETAAPYLVLMAALAWHEGRRREALGWAAAIGVLALALAAHAYGWSGVVRPLDPASPGWAGMLGFGQFVRSIVAATGLSLFPTAFAAPLVAIAMIGWSGWRDPAALRVAATLGLYALLLSLFGRADNFYWALLVAPLVPAGLVLAPDAIRDLSAAALDRRRITVRRVVR